MGILSGLIKAASKKAKPKVDSNLSIKKDRSNKRDWSNVNLKDRQEGLAEKFLENHGFNYSETPRIPETYTYDTTGKIKAYTSTVNSKTGKQGISEKTFNNPTLKSLRDWMGY